MTTFVCPIFLFEGRHDYSVSHTQKPVTQLPGSPWNSSFGERVFRSRILFGNPFCAVSEFDKS